MLFSPRSDRGEAASHVSALEVEGVVDIEDDDPGRRSAASIHGPSSLRLTKMPSSHRNITRPSCHKSARAVDGRSITSSISHSGNRAPASKCQREPAAEPGVQLDDANLAGVLIEEHLRIQ